MKLERVRLHVEVIEIIKLLAPLFSFPGSLLLAPLISSPGLLLLAPLLSSPGSLLLAPLPSSPGSLLLAPFLSSPGSLLAQGLQWRHRLTLLEWINAGNIRCEYSAFWLLFFCSLEAIFWIWTVACLNNLMFVEHLLDFIPSLFVSIPCSAKFQCYLLEA